MIAMDVSSIFTEYISVLTLVICMCVGYVVKNVIPNETVNRFIPLIAATLGVVINVWVAMDFTPQVIAAGLVSGLASTGTYELVDQITKLVDMTGDKD